jgi:DNA-binding NtrC family response regulator
MAAGNILLIDDEEKLRSLLSRIIHLEGFTIFEAGNLKAGMKILEKESIDVVLCDVKLPDGTGVDFVNTAKQKFPQIEIILLTAYGNIPDGVQAMKNGAFDYITKGDDNDKIIPLLNHAIKKVQLQKRVDQLEKQVGKKYGFESILGNTPLLNEAIAMAKKVAPTDATALLLGETGTGKEVFAQAICNGSKRKGNPFMALNCSAFGKNCWKAKYSDTRPALLQGRLKTKKD